jgi:hypothetical protein
MIYYYDNIEVPNLNLKCLIQIRDNEGNAGQGRIKKLLKTMYHIVYNCDNYSVKKSDLVYNIHGQVCLKIEKLNKIK